MAAITVQSKSGVCLTTLSSVHNLIKSDDIVSEHIQNVKMRSSCSSKGYKELRLGLHHVMNYGAKLHSLMRWWSAAFF